MASQATDDDYYGGPIIEEPIAEPEDNEIDWDKLENQEDESTVPKLPWEKDVRLPKNILPIHYDLYLFPELEEGTYYLISNFVHLSNLSNIRTLNWTNVCF